MDREVKEYVEEEEYPVIISSEDIVLRDAQKLVSRMHDKSYQYLKEYGLASVEEAIHEVFQRRHSGIDGSVHNAKRICLKFFLHEGRQNENIPHIDGKHKQLLEMLQENRQYHEAQLN
jgi:hypothetical protein